MQFLLSGFTEGFHTGLIALPQTSWEGGNLRSASEDPAAVEELLQAEVDKGFLIGPFESIPFSSWRINPIGLVSKKNTNKKRLIYDLSAPHASVYPSLNSLIPSEEFFIKYSSIDEAIKEIVNSGRGSWLAKADISDTFKLLPVKPYLWGYYGLQWANRYYFANRLTFGSKSSPWLFDQFAKALHWILVHHGGLPSVIHYLDDFLVIEGPQGGSGNLATLLQIFSCLQVPIAHAKTEGPAHRVTFLGITLDSIRMEASLSGEKLTSCRAAISHALSVGYLSRVELQSLLGRFNFASRIMPQGRAFTSRLLQLLPSAPDQSSIVHLDSHASADLAMWSLFLSSWNGISLFVPSWAPSYPTVFSDAAASRGYAAIFGSHWMAGQWPVEIWSVAENLNSSSLLELYPIVAAAQVWGHRWANTPVMFITDNQALVDIITKGRAKPPRIMSLMRRLVWLSLTHNFHVFCSHIPGVENVAADALSRFNFPLFFQVLPGADPAGFPLPVFQSLVMD